MVMDWPASSPLASVRLLLEPLTVRHADEMVDVLAAPVLYDYIGGAAPSAEQLAARYARQALGRSPDGRQGWLNWIVRRKDTHEGIGYTQATLEFEGSAVVADLAWLITPRHQGNGYASEAAAAMCGWLRQSGVDRFAAFINSENRASIGVARSLGMNVTAVVVDGESRWEL